MRKSDSRLSITTAAKPSRSASTSANGTSNGNVIVHGGGGRRGELEERAEGGRCVGVRVEGGGEDGGGGPAGDGGRHGGRLLRHRAGGGPGLPQGPARPANDV